MASGITLKVRQMIVLFFVGVCAFLFALQAWRIHTSCGEQCPGVFIFAIVLTLLAAIAIAYGVLIIFVITRELDRER